MLTAGAGSLGTSISTSGGGGVVGANEQALIVTKRALVKRRRSISIVSIIVCHFSKYY